MLLYFDKQLIGHLKADQWERLLKSSVWKLVAGIELGYSLRVRYINMEPNCLKIIVL